MINAYSQNVTLATESFIPFNSVTLIKGATAVVSGATSIQLNKAGVYQVTYAVTGTPAAAGSVVINMLKDGVTQNQATAQVPDAVTTAGVAVTMTTLVQVQHDNGPCCCQSPTTLQLQNNGVGLDGANVSLVVTKIC